MTEPSSNEGEDSAAPDHQDSSVTPSTKDTAGAVARFFGGLLMVVGALVMATSGLCTFFGLAIVGTQGIFTVLIFAIPTFLVGLVIYRVGGRLWGRQGNSS